MTKEIWLADSNILLRSFIPSAEGKELVAEAVDRLHRRNAGICVAPQNLVEVRNVASRPLRYNGYGLSPADADQLLDDIQRVCDLLPIPDRTVPTWRELVLRHRVIGTQVHDAFLAAAMLANGVSCILTLNDRDFRRFADDGIRAMTPTQLAAG